MQFENLNPIQQEAVLTTDGPLMILAGAGSGKTRTLVAKILYLLQEKRVSPYQILALTFSNKAAREMRERIASEGQQQLGTLHVQTFHSFCAMILRNESHALGLTKNFTIYDDGESKSIVKALLEKRGLTPKQLNPLYILFFIDQMKNQGYYKNKKEAFFKDDEALYLKWQNDELFGYFLEYEAELHKSNALDFGGLITGVLELFATHPEIKEKYSQRFKYILIDEYQDTNRAQFELVLNLLNEKKNICVVGDEDQSIYSWRGADIRNILDFEKFFPELKLIKLEQNYRSCKNIINAASAVIAKNQARSGKSMWTENEEGNSIKIIECQNDKYEAEYVVSRIIDLTRKEKVAYRDMAVFYRNNSQSRMIEDVLRKEKIPYRIVGGVKFYDRKEIKDICAYLRLLINPKDSISLYRIINNPPRGIGATSLKKIEFLALEQNLSLKEAIAQVVEDRGRGAQSGLKFQERIFNALKEFNQFLDDALLFAKENIWPSQIYEYILSESGYFDFLKKSKDYESLARMENLQEFLNAIKQYEQSGENPTLVGLLESITLNSIESSEEVKSEDGELSMMTIHGSKGLEFPYVFLVGVEENIFPSYKSLESSEMALEEERRLFYVAMTRAMKGLSILLAQSRLLHGNLAFNGPSRFLMEIPEEYYDWEIYPEPGSQGTRSFASSNSHSSFSSRPSPKERHVVYDEMSTYRKGSRVSHTLYGEGLVLESEGMGADEKVLISFPGGVKKKFMVKFAPIKVVEYGD